MRAGRGIMEVAKAGYCQNAAQGYWTNLPQRLNRVRSWKAIGRGTDSFYTGVSKCHTVPQDSCGHAGQGVCGKHGILFQWGNKETELIR